LGNDTANALTSKQQTPWPDYSDYQTSQENLWLSFRKNLGLNDATHQPLVRQQIAFLQKQPNYINELVRNATPYLFYIASEVRRYGLPAEIALIPMIESDYNPFGISKKGAVGLWQMMPNTATELGIKINHWYDGRRNIVTATNAALQHLKYLHSYFGDWLLALAAYDSGDGTVRAAIHYNQKHHLPTDFWSLPLPQETKHYVPKLLALAAIIKDPHRYGISLKAIPNRPYLQPIKVSGHLDLNQLSELSATDTKTLRLMNTGFRHWNHIPAATYWLVLPYEKLSTFTHHLAAIENKDSTLSQPVSIPHEKTSPFLLHKVQPGESLSNIAKHYHVAISDLTKWNHIQNKNDIRAGQIVRIKQPIPLTHSKSKSESKYRHS